MEASFNLIEKQEHIELAARALKAIAHPLRLKILCVVGDQEACVQESSMPSVPPKAIFPSIWPSCGRRACC